jgi:soluble lytic murein transglycosylase-like protein
MTRKIYFCALALVLGTAFNSAQAGHRAPPATNTELDAMIARHAAAEGVPEDLVRRVIKRESRGNPRVVSKGNYGLMQIKPATARGVGYSGNAAGLLDPETNMTYAVKYLAGAWRVAGGNRDLAVHYYAAGYYYAAKSKGLAGSPSAKTANVFALASNAAEKDNPALQY